ncbi:GNAT family N-acetyltransferase, partial [Mycobacterium sp.]|uniref:GNAT family N-acetyltransferase n=1 Tax=Mycobacterium sp. TaxID=1785 RepID=UPI003BB1738C
MISYQWCSTLNAGDREEVLALVAAAAEFDEEAGFSHIQPDEVDTVGREGLRVFHLPVKAHRDLSFRDDAPKVIVSYLRLLVDDAGLGTIQYVVHPDYRSRGLTTMLVEELGLDVDARNGWADTGARALRCWAYGTHPASERLTRRFGISAVSRLSTLIRHLSGPFADTLDPRAYPTGTTASPARPPDDPDASKQIQEVLGATPLSDVRYERLEKDIRDGKGWVITAADDSGTAVGFVCYDPEPFPHIELRAAAIRALVMASPGHGAGLGTALLSDALEALLKEGAQVAVIRIDPDDEGAARIVRRLSFE